MSETKSSTITIPVADLPGLREFAVEWMGSDPWRTILTTRPLQCVGSEQHHYEPVLSEWMEDQCDILWRFLLPLHIPAGFALGVAWLAKRHGGEPAALRPRDHGQWWLYGVGGDEFRDILAIFMPKEPAVTLTEFTVLVVPALADIPEQCEMCDGKKWGASPCLICNGTGKHPNRAVLALRACLLAGAT